MPDRVSSNNPAYVAAYALAKSDQPLQFELAYPLALLVLNDGGGPVKTGKKFPIKTARALQKQGFVELHTDYDTAFEQTRSHGQLNGDMLITTNPNRSTETTTSQRYVIATPDAIRRIKAAVDNRTP